MQKESGKPLLSYKKAIEYAKHNKIKLAAVEIEHDFGLDLPSRYIINIVAEDATRHPVTAYAIEDRQAAAQEAQELLAQVREHGLLLPIRELDTTGIETVKDQFCEGETLESIRDAYIARTERAGIAMTLTVLKFVFVDLQITEKLDKVKSVFSMLLPKKNAEPLVDAATDKLGGLSKRGFQNKLSELESLGSNASSSQAMKTVGMVKNTSSLVNKWFNMDDLNEMYIAAGINIALKETGSKTLSDYIQKLSPHLKDVGPKNLTHDDLKPLLFIAGIINHASDAGIINRVGQSLEITETLNKINYASNKATALNNTDEVYRQIAQIMPDLTRDIQHSALLASLDEWFAEKGEDILNTPVDLSGKKARYHEELKYRSDIYNIKNGADVSYRNR